MEKLTKNRKLRFASLPYSVLLLVTLAGYAFVGQAEATEETVVTAHRLQTTDVQDLRVEFEDTAEDAAWRTRIAVAAKLSARLNLQHRRYRLASRTGAGWNQTG